MVLAKKKLKEKLRSLLATSVEAAESGKASEGFSVIAEEVNRRLQSLKELLASKNRRDNRSTRRGGKKKNSSPGGIEEVADGAETAVESENVVGSSNEKKRKREDDGTAALNEQKKQEKKLRRKKKEKRMKMIKKAKDKKKNAKIVQENAKEAEATAKTDEREENGDAGKKVYVGGIPFYSTEDDIRSFFESCGTVTEIDCMMFPESGKFRGIAILSFKTEAGAKRALALDGSDMGGLFLKIKPYKGVQKPQKSEFSPEVIEGYNRVYVGNLAWEITEEDLRKFFQDCRIATIRFGEDKATGEFKGYAHVDFHDGASVAAALKLDQAEICGRPAKISCAVPKKGTAATATAARTAAPPLGTEKKKKRQTCYECGVPGHLSSECPQKKPSSTS